MIVCSLVVTLFWVIAMAPALLLVEPARNVGIQLGGLDGTVWSGSANRLRIVGPSVNYALVDIHWRFQPSSLLRGASCFIATSDGGRGFASLSGTFCMHLNGSVAAVDVEAEVPAATLLRSEQIRLQGTALVDIDKLTLGRDGTIDHFGGRGAWLQAGAVFDNSFSLPLGDLAIIGRHSDPAGIGFRLVSEVADDAELKQGTVALDLEYHLELNGAWRMVGVVAPGTEMSAVARDWLAALAQVGAHGDYTVDWRGP